VEIHAQQVGVDGPHGPLLRPTSLRIGPGQLVLVSGEPGAGHTALALALAGQLRPSTGAVLLDGRPDNAALRQRVAVVDAPQVTEPDEALKLSALVGEELALNGAPAGRKAVAAWLDERAASQYAASRVRALPGPVRTRVLVELAAARPGVQALVLDCPDRHTGDARSWWELARRAAEPPRTVVALCTDSSAHLLGVPAARLGEQNQELIPTRTEAEEKQ
jgi:ABC-type multidrug transport system ATPase subunit